MGEPQPSHENEAGHAEVLRLWQRFHVRLTGLYGLAVLLVLSLMGALFYRYGVHAELNALQLRMRGVAVAVAAGVDPAWVEVLQREQDASRPEYRMLTERFQRIAASEPDLVSLYVLAPTSDPHTLRFVADYVREGKAAAAVGQPYDARQAAAMLDGLVRATYEQQIYSDEWGPTMSGYAPIRDAQGRAVALAGCDVQAARVQAMKGAILRTTLAIYGLATLLLALLGARVARHVREPLGGIIQATAALAHGDLSARAELRREDEFGILGRRFNQMAEGLEEREYIRATFGRYVSEEVARRVLSSRDAAALGGEERVVTILFTDLRGFSTLAERLSPPEVVRILNVYLGEMGEVIERHHGCVIEVLGDALLCVFGAPEDQPGHAEAAVRCADGLRSALGRLNERWIASGEAARWQTLGLGRLEQRIGVHTGRVVAGNLGSRSRVKYAVVGDAVNVASRVENLNNNLGTELLFTQEVFDALPDELRARAEDRGEHLLKGRASPSRIYTLR